MQVHWSHTAQDLVQSILSISVNEDVFLTPSEVQEKKGKQKDYFFPVLLSSFCSWVLKADIGADAGGQGDSGKEGLLR